MATTAQLMVALDKLTKPTNANKFPGMPDDKIIIENYIKKKYPAYAQFDTAAERKKFMDDTYKLVEQEVKMHIFTVKATYTGIKDGIKQVQATIHHVRVRRHGVWKIEFCHYLLSPHLFATLKYQLEDRCSQAITSKSRTMANN